MNGSPFPMRAIPFVVLAAGLVGIVGLSTGLKVSDTIGMLVCAAGVGAALAVIAGRRRR